MRSFTRKGRLAATVAVLVMTAGLPPALSAAAADPPVATHPYLVGRGVSDATGEVAEVGMLGYADPAQVAEGLHTRLRSRAFVIVDRATGNRVLLIIADSPMIFGSIRQRVLRGLVARYGEEYSEQNVLIAATHSHAGPGGYAHHLLYNLTTLGYHEKTFDAITSGMLESVERAHADHAPSALRLTHGELHDANVNRSREAFENNPESDKAFFPEGRDPQTSLLRIERDGRPVGAINWFPSHNTAMSVQNKLISADHKGYAAYHWEREVHDVDYLAAGNPDFISAFAQTNAGDMSPNVPRHRSQAVHRRRGSTVRSRQGADRGRLPAELPRPLCRHRAPGVHRRWQGTQDLQAGDRRGHGRGQHGGQRRVPHLQRGRESAVGRRFGLGSLHRVT
jgi:neutral ceramidase